MIPEALFRTAEFGRILKWAGQASALPIALHQYAGARETRVITSSGRCGGCAYIAGTQKGPAACRASRESAAKNAFKLGMASPFICHAGFACCAMPLMFDEARFVMTFGPYCPSEETRALEDDFLSALRKLAVIEGSRSPIDLYDVWSLPASIVPAVAEQTARRIMELWERVQNREKGPVEAVPDIGSKPARRPRPKGADSLNGATIAAAMAAGDRDKARALIRSALDHAKEGKRLSPAVLRARAVTVAAGAVEASARAGADIVPVLRRFPDFLGTIAQGKTSLALSTLILDLLQVRKRRAGGQGPSEGDLEGLHNFIVARLPETVTLKAAAEFLGRNPTTITQFMKRKYGMSFSDYVGRLRVDAAKDLMRRTRLSNVEIAMRIGISDQSNFAKLFKKFEMMTPAEFRRKHRLKT